MKRHQRSARAPNTQRLQSHLAFIMAVGCVIAAASISSLAMANEEAASNEAQAIDLGIKPDISAGPAVIIKPNHTYLAFRGTQYDSQGGAVADGLSLIQLSGCSDWKLRMTGDEELATHPVDIQALDHCETYEVANSDWADSSQNERHFIVTFLGFNPGISHSFPDFECVAQDATVHFVGTDSFDDVLMYVDFLESEDPQAGDEDPTADEDPTSEEDPGSYDEYDPGASDEYDPGTSDEYDPGTYDQYDAGGYE